MTMQTRAGLRTAYADASLPARRWPARLGFVLLFALLAISGTAHADARGDARTHYRNGLELLANGQTERAIEEFKAAYAIRPHPDALYNIARAYVDLGNIPEALNYFRRYIANDPEDKEQVLAVMNRLNAAIAKPTDRKAEEKKTEEASAAATTAPTTTGPVSQMDAQQLIAKLQELLGQKPTGTAAAPATEAPAVETKPAVPETPADEFEATTVAASSRATAKDIAAELAGSRRVAQSEDIFEEQVVTAGARATTEEKAPASITIIGEEEIRLSGAMSIPEILRRVPGIDVAEMNPSDVNISARGFNRRLANKLLVLVDGRSVYQDFLGVTLWPLLNIAMQDIARVEVVRGPGSALYGANAFAGVVNIITKTGEDQPGVTVYAQAGNHDAIQSNLAISGKSGHFNYRTSLGYDRHDKWTRDQDDTLPGWQAQFSQPNRSREVTRADATVGYDFGKTRVSASGGYNNFASEIFPNGAVRTFLAEGQGGFAQAQIVNGQTRLNASWTSLRLHSGPEYWPNQILKFDSQTRSDVIDVQAQTGFEFKALGQHSLNVGGGWRYKDVLWTYLEPHIGDSTAACLTANPSPNCTNRYDENHFDLFVQEQWTPSKKVDVVLGYRLDRSPLLAASNATPGGLIHSGRGSLLYSFTREHVLRFTLGTSFRAPTFFESYTNLYAPVPNQPALGVVFNGDRGLKPESIIQAEIGYRGKLYDKISLEAVVYGQRVTDLILDSSLQPPTLGRAVDPRTGGYVVGYAGFENTNAKFFGVGSELGVRYTPIDGLDLGINYSYEKIFDCTSGCTSEVNNAALSLTSSLIGNTAAHKVNLLVLWKTRANIDVSMDAHFVSGVTWVENVFDPSNAAAVGGISFLRYDLPSYALINGRVGYRIVKDKLDVGLAVYNLLGDDHREHPYGNQIGRRVTVTASGAF